ncbi:MAG: hypothetical protein M0R06_05300 [Sphaerochaeta sp.]|jgi:hypothetical protein|nr:hypothetical protein [Sphaerochaeta sp.]
MTEVPDSVAITASFAFGALVVRELVGLCRDILAYTRRKSTQCSETMTVTTGQRDQLTDHERRISRLEGQLGLD